MDAKRPLLLMETPPLTHAPGRLPRIVAAAGVVAILLTGTIGLKWGLPYYWEPDEKVDLAADMIARRSFDPHYFINPHLHLYGVAGLVWLADHVWSGQMQSGLRAMVPLTDPRDPNRRLHIAASLLGRGLSVLCAALAVWVLWRSLCHTVGAWPAALASFALGISLGLMNVAHFATPEACLILFVTLALGAFCRLGESGRIRDAVLAGMCFGLACSTKYTAVLLVVPLAWVLVAVIWRTGFMRTLDLAITTGGVAAAAFFLTTPFALLNWDRFVTDGLIFTWVTGAPEKSLVGVRRSWLAYGQHLADALSWPLFILAIVAVLAWAVRRKREADARGALRVHAVWIVGFWGFLGLSPHHAMRFITPVLPSLAAFAGWGANSLLEAARRTAWRNAARATVAATFMYAAAYTAAGVYWFVADTRYAAGEWLGRHLPAGVGVSYFGIESYLPYFDRPTYRLTGHMEVWPLRPRDADFDVWRHETFSSMNDVIVDSNFFYDRFFVDEGHWPGRTKMYSELLAGTDPDGYRLVAKFQNNSPWWLHPQLELVAPTIVVFAKPGQIRD